MTQIVYITQMSLPVHKIPHFMMSDYWPEPQHIERVMKQGLREMEGPWCPFCYSTEERCPTVKWWGISATVNFLPMQALSSREEDPRPYDRAQCVYCKGVAAITYPRGKADDFYDWLRSQTPGPEDDPSETES